jgi:hypothetical protein
MLAYGTQRGAGWRLDCGASLASPQALLTCLDRYPQGVVQAGAQDVWKRSPVALETCGAELVAKGPKYTFRT